MHRPHVVCLVAKSPLPPVTGSRLRIKRLVEGLVQLGSVTVVIGANVTDDERRLLQQWQVGRVVIVPAPPRRPTFLERLQWVAGLGPEREWLYRSHAPVVEALREELQRSPDVVWTAGRWAARYLNGLPHPPLVVDMQASERVALAREIASAVRRRGASALPRVAQLAIDARARLTAERWLWSHASLITPVSQHDADRIPPRWAHKARIVINGVDLPETIRESTHAPRIVFLGNFNYEPNAEAAEWIVRIILPHIRAARPDAELRLVGRAPETFRAALAAPGVVFTGFVEDLSEAFGDCSAALLAVRSGAGTKLKVLDALAHGVPVVTTAVGNEGIGTRDGVHVLVRESPTDLANAVLRIFDDPELAARLAANGRDLVAHAHGWPHAAAELRAGIETVLARR
jgi:glycosyltransferase involved in cell wall biosynthesis